MTTQRPATGGGTGAGVTRILRRPRLTRLKQRVPASAKRWPKELHGELLTVMAKQARRAVDPQDAVLIASWPRSGSTWLFEMLASDRSAMPVFEPFNPRFNPKFESLTDALGFLGKPKAEDAERARDLVREVAAGRLLTRWSANRTRRDRIWRSPRTLVKEVRVGPGLPWVVDVLGIPTIVLLRHPCAVIESMQRSPGRWQEWPEGLMREALLGRGVSTDMLATLDDASRPEYLAALWAVDTRIAVESAGTDDRIMVITYEGLVNQPAETLASVGDFIGFEDVAADPSRLSLQTHATSPLRGSKPRDALASWKSRLDGGLAESIIHTANRFGIAIYSTEEPQEPPDITSIHRSPPSSADR